MNCLPQSLEHRLTNMVIVVAGYFSQVQRDPAMRRQGTKELSHALGRQIPNLLTREWNIVKETSAAAKVNRDHDQRFIHGRDVACIPNHRLRLVQGLRKRLS